MAVDFYYPGTALTSDEATELDAQLETIDRAVTGFIEMGEALRTIRDKQLYKANHRTFDAFCENYCQERWGFGRRHAYQLIDAATTFENVRGCAQIEPVSEAQMRPLTALKHNPDLQKEAWQIAVESAPIGRVTGTYVGQVVDALRPLSKLDSTPKLQKKALQVIRQESREEGFTRERVEAVVNQVFTDLPSTNDRWAAENGQPIQRYKVVQEAADKAAEAWVQQQTEEELRRKVAEQKQHVRSILDGALTSYAIEKLITIAPSDVVVAYDGTDTEPPLERLNEVIDWFTTFRQEYPTMAERKAD